MAPTGVPKTASVPPDTVDSPMIMRMVVVLPAPLGPSRPMQCACSTSKLMPLTACKLPKHLTKSRATMIDVLSMDDT